MAPSTPMQLLTRSPVKQQSLILMAMVVVLAMPASSMAQGPGFESPDDFLFRNTNLDAQAKSVVKESLEQGDACGNTIDDLVRSIQCIDKLRSATAGNLSNSDSYVRHCCFDLGHRLGTSCFCGSIEKNQAKLGIDLPKVCGDDPFASTNHCKAFDEQKRKEEALNSLGACGQLFRKMASGGEQPSVDDFTSCAQQIATCSASCQKQ